jgi:hypothetical protein
MKYRVHHLEVSKDNMQEKLEQFLNRLYGEVVSIVPNVTQFFMMYGENNLPAGGRKNEVALNRRTLLS